jgi:hypothetical protein
MPTVLPVHGMMAALPVFNFQGRKARARCKSVQNSPWVTASISFAWTMPKILVELGLPRQEGHRFSQSTRSSAVMAATRADSCRRSSPAIQPVRPVAPESRRTPVFGMDDTPDVAALPEGREVDKHKSYKQPNLKHLNVLKQPLCAIASSN